MEDNDAQLQLKKRARRRLIGAVFFVSVVAVVLPTVMDQEPRQQVADVEIRIPGQDDKPFAPKFASAAASKPVDDARPEPAPPEPVPVAPTVKAPVGESARPTARLVDTGPVERKADEKPAKPADKPLAKPPEKPLEKIPPVKLEKPAEKNPKVLDRQAEKLAADKQAAEKAAAEKLAAEKAAEKLKAEEARRAAAILSGGGDAGKAATIRAGGEHLVLIGAFASEENVRNLKSKLSELGIRTYSEPLDTPQGRKTRLRAGPFPTRDAADKALEKMKKIGVSGVVAAKP